MGEEATGGGGAGHAGCGMPSPGESQALVLRAVGSQVSRGGTWSGLPCEKLTVGWRRAGGSKQVNGEALSFSINTGLMNSVISLSPSCN